MASHPQRPNVLLLMTDQQRADHLGCMGNPVLRTPHLDALAARGVRCTNMHVVNPICQPNRATILTGRYPTSHGVRSNGIALSLNARTFTHVMRDHGYRTAMIGKGHLQNMTGMPAPIEPPGAAEYERRDGRLLEGEERGLDGPGYDAESTPLWRADPQRPFPSPYYGFDHVELCTMHGDQVSGHYEAWLRERHAAPDTLRGPANALDKGAISTPRAWRTALPEELYPTTYVAERSCAFIDGHVAENDGQPFFLKCSFPDPHAPFTPPGRYWSMYDPDDIAVPASFGKGDSPLLAYMRRTFADGSEPRNTEFPFAIDAREAQEAIALTYGMIAMIDDAIGRVMERLAAHGLLDDTLVIFMSDHGDEMGDHGILQKGPMHYRGSVRIPFLWSDPENPSAHGGVATGLASCVDVAQTLLARLGLPVPYGVQGVDLGPMLAGREAAVRTSVYLEDDRERTYLGFTEPQRLRTVITPTHRLTVYHPMGWYELFDLAGDPLEIDNLWEREEASELRFTMTHELLLAAIGNSDRLPFVTAMA